MRLETNKLMKLEAVRGFAALYVVFHHSVHSLVLWNINFAFLFKFGQEAVILFFILSGFLIEYSFSKSRNKSFKIYFFKRFLRIYIPLVLVFFLNYLILSINQNVNINFFVLLGNIFMLQDISSLKPNVIVNPFLGNSPLWSLSYEWWFYMLYFPLTTYFKRKSSLIVYVLAIFSAITYIFYPNFLNRELMYLTIWWSGVEISRLYTKKQAINLKNLRTVLVVLSSITFILAINAYLHFKNFQPGVSPLLEFRHFLFSLISIFAALTWKHFKWIGFSNILGIFVYFAPISYGVYISHYFLISNAFYLDNIIKVPLLRYSVYVFICFLFAFFIERIVYVKLKKIIMRIIYSKALQDDTVK